MWSCNRRLFIGAAGLAALSGCGFEPVYGTGKPASDIIGKVDIQVQNGRTAFELRERLQSRLGYGDSQAPYYLSYSLKIEEKELVVNSSVEITRYNLLASAEYQILQRASGKTVFKDTVFTTTSYSATSETFPTRVAERDANIRLAHSIADQIITRLSITAKDWLQ